MVELTQTENVYLAAAEYVDSDHTTVIARAEELTQGSPSLMESSRRIFSYIRDLRYGAPDFDNLNSFRASDLLLKGGGYCVPKACALVALCRASGIPARLCFADVSNHLATPNTLELMGGEVFAWHGYAEILLNEMWLKLSPTFDAPLCERLGVPVLEFDGVNHAHLQQFDSNGRSFMSYDRLHGSFHDVLAKFLASEMPKPYPRAYAAIKAGNTG